MELTYDYGKWSRRNAVEEFVRSWIARQFGGRLTAAPKVDCLLMQTRGSARMCQGTFFFIVWNFAY